MLNVLYGSAKEVIKSPKALIPVFIASIIGCLLAVVFSLTAIKLIVKIVTEGTIVNNNSISAALLFLRMHTRSLAILFGTAIASAWLAIFSGIYYCRYVGKGKKASVSDALGFAFRKIGDSIIFLIVAMVTFFMFALGGFFLALLQVPWHWLYIFLISIYVLIVFLVTFRLFLFAIPALAHEKNNTKKAMQASWKFTGERFWQSVVLAMILILFAISFGILPKMLLVDIEDTLLVVAVLAVFNTITMSFCLGALTLYYSKHTS